MPLYRRRGGGVIINTESEDVSSRAVDERRQSGRAVLDGDLVDAVQLREDKERSAELPGHSLTVPLIGGQTVPAHTRAREVRCRVVAQLTADRWIIRAFIDVYNQHSGSLIGLRTVQ